MNKHESWLKLTIEEPLEPALPICDTHHHLWDRPGSHYLLDELLQDISGHHIVQTVFVECREAYRKDGPEEMQSVGETEFVENIVAQGASGQQGIKSVIAGIVGFADLTLGAAVEPVLEAHLAVSRTRFRGVRHISTWDASPEILSRKIQGLLLNTKFREGFARLRKYGLSFDAWMYHTQLMDLVDLARAFLDTTIILNHVGTPLGIGPYAGKHEEVLQEWKRGIAALASCPNVVVKLGGFGMPHRGFGWTDRPTPPDSAELAGAIEPYILWCIAKFGADRCMFESNFPVDRVSYSYTILVNAFKRLTKNLSHKERAALFHDTAVKVYRLSNKREA